jgi:hypothetical protein
MREPLPLECLIDDVHAIRSLHSSCSSTLVTGVPLYLYIEFWVFRSDDGYRSCRTRWCTYIYTARRSTLKLIDLSFQLVSRATVISPVPLAAPE